MLSPACDTFREEQTNEDLIQSASKEQLVDELFRFWMEVIYHSEFELREEEIEFVKLKIKAWLKQPHTTTKE